ncbi:MAG: ABC transporter ATP-binding protein [Deltaproteobacteria bacterium]|nr:ABC transporter ATP-binding protein [Deltaproteobacteria bacterium]
MAVVTLEGVTKVFGASGRRSAAVRALDAIGLTIDDGEFFSFVGPSGCGKSTALHLIAGLETADAGTIRFDGVRVNDLEPKDRDVSLVFQSYALYPHMSVRQNVGFPLKVRRVPRREIDTAVARVAASVGIESLLDRRPRALSGGQRQRVALARALVRRPRVFLMDEPLSNLDARLRLEMRTELKRIHQASPVTTVYVTHDQEEAMTMSDRIAVMHRGQLQQCGTPAEIYRTPANCFVASFMGSPPINFFKGGFLARLLLNDVEGVVFRGLAPDGLSVGLRPEDLSVRASSSPTAKGAATGAATTGPWIPGTLRFVEDTGRERWGDVDCGGQMIRARISGSVANGRTQVGQTVAVDIVSTENIQRFDASTERRLCDEPKVS